MFAPLGFAGDVSDRTVGPARPTRPRAATAGMPTIDDAVASGSWLVGPTRGADRCHRPGPGDLPRPGGGHGGSAGRGQAWTRSASSWPALRRGGHARLRPLDQRRQRPRHWRPEPTQTSGPGARLQTSALGADPDRRPMRVGIGLWCLQSTATAPRAFTGAYQELLDDARLAERVGIDSLWLSEHHGYHDGYCPALLPAAAGCPGRDRAAAGRDRGAAAPSPRRRTGRRRPQPS